MTSSLIALIALSFCLGCGCWLIFLWAVHKGEFTDLERPKHRMLDDEAPLPDRIEQHQPHHPPPPAEGLARSRRESEGDLPQHRIDVTHR